MSGWKFQIACSRYSFPESELLNTSSRTCRSGSDWDSSILRNTLPEPLTGFRSKIKIFPDLTIAVLTRETDFHLTIHFCRCRNFPRSLSPVPRGTENHRLRGCSNK